MSLLARAERVLPGGVNSPVRAFRGVGGEPVFVRAAQGAWLWAEDGRRYIDFIGAYGPHILGHRHPAVLAAIQEALGRGTAFGAPTLPEVELAERIAGALPAVEMATASAPRRTTAPAMKLQWDGSSTLLSGSPRRSASAQTASRSAGSSPAAMARKAPARSPPR